MTNNQQIKDLQDRERALAPQQSFIVQAPAGSGKTELLTQRFLLLLSQVNQPEEILAITFTKKASAEMRARIIKTLKNAATDPEPLLPHEKKTWLLAQRALEQDKLLNWNLLANPNRLRIQTMDSFNAGLIKFLPILSHFGAPPDITDSPETLYREAVEEFLKTLEDDAPWSEAIAELLSHTDNDLEKVQTLLITMLSNRDQWLGYLANDINPQELRQILETNLAAIVTDTLKILQSRFPANLMNETLEVVRFAATTLHFAKNESKILECLDIVSFPEASHEFKPVWLGLAELFLTKDNEWRKMVTKNQGFPAKTDGKSAAEKNQFAAMKTRHKELITALTAHEDLLAAFAELMNSPSTAYTDNQWKILQALSKVLVVAVAQLKVTFRNAGKIDYIENSLAALYALGSEEAPTDLALTLDYQIKHILIDEFQDTSNSQYRLIVKLTAGWQPQDGRTLFVVGDPMQSIYRFREADVGLFIRARNQGIGNIKLEPLTLAVNFRSTANVVNWVNEHFSQVLPAYDDIGTGAVSYSPSTANNNNHDGQSFVKIHSKSGLEKNSQAESIVELVKTLKQQNSQEKIAILVRARTHLSAIIPALVKAQLNFRAIKIDPLLCRPVIQDLISLTRALLNPADRVAWMSILRAPWCGLTLNDLLILGSASRDKILFDILPEAKLSTDGQHRMARVLPVLKLKMAERQRCTLHQWIESTWLSLGGAACLEHDSELDDANAYFNLLDELDEGGRLNNLGNLTAAVKKLFAAPDNQADNTLQIMTIHNAKGLEFDTVILPHLEKSSGRDEKKILLWMEKSRENTDSALLLAPIPAAGAKDDSIYEYIKYQHATKTGHETARLLYVAVTRAKKQLHLFYSPAKKIGGSLLEKLAPALAGGIEAFNTDDNQSFTPAVTTLEMKRLKINWKNPVTEILTEASTKHQKMPGFLLSKNNAKIIGTVVHKILENICHSGAAWWQDRIASHRNDYIKSQLMQSGLPNLDLTLSTKAVQTAIENTLGDSRGKWILQPHKNSQTEVPLTALIDGEINQLVIDRTFIDDTGTRWIIDYKTSHPEHVSLQTFLQREYEEYAGKMQLYYHAMRYQNDNLPVKLGLYFPLIPAWKEWEIS